MNTTEMITLFDYFTADLHFGHANIIKCCDRPFDSVEDMDEYIITMWNETVSDNDWVCIVGDFSLKGITKIPRYVQALKGDSQHD